MNPKEIIRGLLAEGKILEAIEFWLGLLPGSDHWRDELVLLKGRYQEIQQYENRGLHTLDEASTGRARIAKALMDNLDTWQPGGDTDPLRQALQRLSFDPDPDLGPHQLVNCNRQTPSRRFRRTFDQHNDAARHFQFYFICACRDEKPNSFAKRLIYSELIQEELDGKDGLIDYPFREADDRIDIVPLPLGSNLEASKKKFKGYVQKRFRFADTQSFENFIETGVPKLPFQYVAAVFDISETAWEADQGEISAYLQWMTDTFRCPHPEVPTFLFFFVIYIRNLYDEAQRTPRQQAILQELEALSQTAPSTVLTELIPLESTHLDDWLYDLGADDPLRNRQVLQALTQALDPLDRRYYEQHERLHMKDVERVQKMVYDILKR